MYPLSIFTNELFLNYFFWLYQYVIKEKFITCIRKFFIWNLKDLLSSSSPSFVCYFLVYSPPSVSLACLCVCVYCVYPSAVLSLQQPVAPLQAAVLLNIVLKPDIIKYNYIILYCNAFSMKRASSMSVLMPNNNDKYEVSAAND
jgi:hypothetical protein